MSFAPNKCKYIIFTREKQKNFFQDDFDIKLYGDKLEKMREIKFLRINFDQYLSFKGQVESIMAKFIDITNIIKVLSHKSWKLDKSTRINLYKSLVKSLIIIYP